MLKNSCPFPPPLYLYHATILSPLENADTIVSTQFPPTHYLYVCTHYTHTHTTPIHTPHPYTHHTHTHTTPIHTSHPYTHHTHTHTTPIHTLHPYTHITPIHTPYPYVQLVGGSVRSRCVICRQGLPHIFSAPTASQCWPSPGPHGVTTSWLVEGGECGVWV